MTRAVPRAGRRRQPGESRVVVERAAVDVQTDREECHMDLFTLLGTLDPDVTPGRCKLHLATWNGVHDPLDLYIEDVFDEWQSDQNRRNFSTCDFIVALIAMSEPDRWLFAGVHSVLGEEPRDGEDRVHYRTSRRAACDEFDGRLVVAFTRLSRQPYPFAEKLALRGRTGWQAGRGRPAPGCPAGRGRGALGCRAGRGHGVLGCRALDVVRIAAGENDVVH